MLPINRGDLVKIRSCPDVDERLWDLVAEVAHVDADHHVFIHFPNGGDCAMLPEHLVVMPAFAADHDVFDKG